MPFGKRINVVAALNKALTAAGDGKILSIAYTFDPGVREFTVRGRLFLTRDFGSNHFLTPWLAYKKDGAAQYTSLAGTANKRTILGARNVTGTVNQGSIFPWEVDYRIQVPDVSDRVRTALVLDCGVICTTATALETAPTIYVNSNGFTNTAVVTNTYNPEYWSYLELASTQESGVIEEETVTALE